MSNARGVDFQQEFFLLVEENFSDKKKIFR